MSFRETSVEDQVREVEGEVQLATQKAKVFMGNNAFNEALQWLEFVRPREFSVKCGNASTGEFGVEVVYSVRKA
jgi:hypothetical protein